MPDALSCKARVIRRKARLLESRSPGVEWRTPPGTASDHHGPTVNSESVGIVGVLVIGVSTGYALLLVARYRE